MRSKIKLLTCAAWENPWLALLNNAKKVADMCAAQSFHHYNRDGTMTLVKIVTAILIVTSLPTLSNTAQADTWDSFKFIDSKPNSEVWLNPGFYSYHFESDLNLNNNNLGFGA